jgi:hypothetical protein
MNTKDEESKSQDNIFMIKYESNDYLIILNLPNITIKNVNLDLEFKGTLLNGRGFQGFISYELLLDALQYELSTRETIKFDMSDDYDKLVMSFCLGEFRREKKYYVVNLQNTFKTISDKINEMETEDDLLRKARKNDDDLLGKARKTEEEQEGEGRISEQAGDSESASISRLMIKKIISLEKKYDMLKKQNALIVETLGNFEKANYQNKMLDISRNMPELPYLSFTYARFEK